MCQRYKSKGRIVKPGDSAQIINVQSNIITAKFGMDIGRIGNRIVNARIEKLDKFWKRFEHCIIPMDSFLEVDRKTNKEHSFISPKDGQAAGLLSPNGHFVIVTQRALGDVQKYHHRMPLFVHPEEWLKQVA